MKPDWMTDRAWKLATARNEREYDRLVREFHREDVRANSRPLKKYTAEEMFGF